MKYLVNTELMQDCFNHNGLSRDEVSVYASVRIERLDAAMNGDLLLSPSECERIAKLFGEDRWMFMYNDYGTCINNEAVNCDSCNGCRKCGWDPYRNRIRSQISQARYGGVRKPVK